MKPTATFVNADRSRPITSLYAHENVVIMPQVGSATIETRTRMAMLAAENLLACVGGKPLLTPVAG